jgi:restriction system protein
VNELSRTRAKTKQKPWYFRLEYQLALGFLFVLFFTAEGHALLAELFLATYPILIAAALAVGFYYFFLKKRKYYRVKDLYEVDKMDGHDFEHYLAPLFERLDYRAEVTKGSGDFGADLILRKKGKKYVVQAKRYSGTIGVSAVQEVVGALGYYKAHGAMVVTNNYFTPAAEELAKHNRVQLIDRDELSNMMKGRRPRRW